MKRRATSSGSSARWSRWQRLRRSRPGTRARGRRLVCSTWPA